jgi:hypothetical protein
MKVFPMEFFSQESFTEPLRGNPFEEAFSSDYFFQCTLSMELFPRKFFPRELIPDTSRYHLHDAE